MAPQRSSGPNPVEALRHTHLSPDTSRPPASTAVSPSSGAGVVTALNSASSGIHADKHSFDAFLDASFPPTHRRVMEEKKRAPRDPRKQAQLVVTVGSTSFPALSDAVLSPSVLEILPELGIASVTVQAGSAEIPVHARGGELTYTTRGGAYVGVRTLRYTRDAVEMDALLKSADVVVSHAGSGSILTALRLGKPLLVVPNEALMDNHQVELADALEKEGYLVTCKPADLAIGLKTLMASTPKPFPAQQPERFVSILDETAGFP